MVSNIYAGKQRKMWMIIVLASVVPLLLVVFASTGYFFSTKKITRKSKDFIGKFLHFKLYFSVLASAVITFSFIFMHLVLSFFLFFFCASQGRVLLESRFSYIKLVMQTTQISIINMFRGEIMI